MDCEVPTEFEMVSNLVGFLAGTPIYLYICYLYTYTCRCMWRMQSIWHAYVACSMGGIGL